MDEFLRAVIEWFNIVIFTASLSRFFFLFSFSLLLLFVVVVCCLLLLLLLLLLSLLCVVLCVFCVSSTNLDMSRM